MPQWQVSHFRRQVYINGLRPRDFAWCSTPSPFSHHENCTVVPWGSLSLLVIPLAPVNSLHHWLVIRRCLSMFNSRTFFTWIDLYFERRLNEFEDPRSSFIHPGCDIFRNIKTSNVHHCQIDDHPNQRMMSPYHQSVTPTIVCPMYMKMNL